MPHDTTDKDIIRLSTEKFRWMTARKVDRIDDLFDKNIVFVHMNGQVTTKKDWMQQFRTEVFRFEQIVPRQMQACVYTNTAVLFGRGTFLVTMYGFKSSWKLAFTEVYALKNKTWKLVNVHSCAC